MLFFDSQLSEPSYNFGVTYTPSVPNDSILDVQKLEEYGISEISAIYQI